MPKNQLIKELKTLFFSCKFFIELNRIFSLGLTLILKTIENLLERIKMRNMALKLPATNACLLFILIATLYSCASIQQPTGGPKDILPPKVLKMVPDNATLNFKAEKVSIEFDEYIKLQNEFKEFSISPEQELPPILKTRGKRLEIEFQDSLEKNTTYTLNFGNSITDINESNALKNFSYVFSTGAVLDSLTISGVVTSAFTRLPELDALVFLLPLKNDSAFGKKKPSIFARTDSSGRYKLKNLRKDTYTIYALKEQNGDKLYVAGNEEIAFLKTPISLTANTDSVNLMLFKEPPPAVRILDRKIGPDGTILLSFNRPLSNPTVKVVDPAALDATKLSRFTKNTDSIRIWLTDFSFDSVKVAVTENGDPLQTVNISRAKKDTYTRTLTATDNLVESNVLNPKEPLKLNFLFPVLSVDSKKITFIEDTTKITNFKIEVDPADYLQYKITYPWKEKVQYEVRFAEGAFTGILGAKNKYFAKKFKPEEFTSNYGSQALAIVLPEKNKQYIFELINESKAVVKRAILNNDSTINLNNYRVGKYYVRIIYDNNKNGLWDTGDLVKKKQPENIFYDPRLFAIRANWEIQEKIIVPKEN